MYKGRDSTTVDKQIMAALADSNFNSMQISYIRDEHQPTLHPELRVYISNHTPGGKYLVKFEIFTDVRNNGTYNRNATLQAYNPGPLVQRANPMLQTFYAGVVEVKLHLAKAKKQFKTITGIQNLYVRKFMVNYYTSAVPMIRHDNQGVINAVHNIKMANAFRKDKLIRKIQKKYLEAHYDPSHPICQRRLLREFESLTL